MDMDPSGVDLVDASTAVARLGGVATTAELRTLLSRRGIARAVEAGEIVRLRTGRYALPGVEGATEAALRLGGTVGLVSAAVEWGWKVKATPTRPTVVVPRGRVLSAERRDGIDVRWADLPAGAVVDGRTSRIQTCLDCARLLPFDEALCVIDSALREGRVTREELVAAAEAGPRTGRARAIGVIRRGDGRSANPFEGCLRAIAYDVAGLEVEAQVQIGEFRVDLADEELMIVVEAESWEYHGGREMFDLDVRRYTELTGRGWLVVRFLWDDVMHRPAQVRATLEAVVRLRTAPRQFIARGAA